METKPSAHHLSAIALLAQSPEDTTFMIHHTELETIQELVFFFGGAIKTKPLKDDEPKIIWYECKIGKCSVSASHFAKNIAVMNQQSAFEGFGMTFVKGAKLQIIDNQYFVLSDDTN